MAHDPEQADSTPMIGLAIAVIALIGAPLMVYLDWQEKKSARPDGPSLFADSVEALDGFWTQSYAQQFPTAASGYARPWARLIEMKPHPLYPMDGVVGLYFARGYEIRVDPALPELDSIFVLAHEFGHHLQNLSGLSRRARQDALWSDTETERQLGVRYELQADCLAGVWAHYEVGYQDGVITEAEVEARFADVSLRGNSNTHGSAKQRANWLFRGFQSGQAAECDTSKPKWTEL